MSFLELVVRDFWFCISTGHLVGINPWVFILLLYFLVVG